MKTKPILAYHGKQAIKDKYLARVRAHRLADQLIHGIYWENGKGCAVGCTVHSANHARYETELGIPQKLARIEDGIFEGMNNGSALLWPERFLQAIKPGADLSRVSDKFLFWLLVDPKDGVIRFAKTDRSRAAIQKVGALYRRKISGKTITREEWKAAAAAAAAAAYAAYVAADAAAAAYAAYVAADTAYAADAADAAYAADAAADAAYAAYAADAARQQARKIQAEKLLLLLRAAK
jgi:hypothetical protein